LTNIRQLLVITTYGAPRDFIEREIGDPGAAFWLKGVARLLAPDCSKTWCAEYGLDSADAEARERFRERVRAALRML
jgi:hypothetical protein